MRKPRSKPDPYLTHEALDRAWMLANMVETHLADHPYIAARAGLRRKADQAVKNLIDIYMIVGRESL